MKKLLIILAIILTGFGCNSKSNKKADSFIDHMNTELDSDKKTISDIDDSLDSVSFLAYNGITTDTIYNDSLTEKAIIVNTQIINNKFYIAYSKYSIEKEIKYDMSFYYIGHYINSYDLEDLPAKKGVLFDYKKIISNDSAILIGESCSHTDRLEFKRLKTIPGSDSIIYIYAIKQNCNEWKTHLVIKKVKRHFEKLLEIESTDNELDFKIQNDSILTCNYKQMFEDGINRNELKYDLIKNIEIE